jgi:hypothetical protein
MHERMDSNAGAAGDGRYPGRGNLVSAGRTASRRVPARAVFAYGAALAMTPYLLIKVSWVVGAVFGLTPRDEHLGVAGVVALNTVTIGMAAAGITLALALVRPWGERIPAFAVLSCAWIGCGFLVPMLPYAVLDSLISTGGSSSASADSVLPAWEYALLEVSFLGMGVGLAGALPFYLRARWPAAFAGRLGDGTAAVRPAGAHRPEATMIALVGTLVVGGLDLYWAAGGTIGLLHPEARELGWYLQTGNAAIWSFAGAWGIGVLARARPAVPLWIPMSVSWLVSGFLVAWGGWKLPFALLQAAGVDVGVVWPERPGLVAAQFVLSIVAGTATLGVVRQVYRARRDRHSALR